jgi:curli production assembly/transport component CsgE
MKLSIVIGLVLLVCLAVTRPQAQVTLVPKEPIKKIESNTDSASFANIIEIDRLIVDETISKPGYDFMDMFFSQWTWPTLTNGAFIIVVSERPFRGITSQIQISVNDMVVFSGFLQSRAEYLELLVADALEQTTAHLLNYETIMKELIGLDMIGTGIY